MAWEWVAPVASASVGIVGIAATYLTGRQARESQQAAQREHFRENRQRELANAQRVLYAKFIGALRELSLLSSAQGVVDDVAQQLAEELVVKTLAAQEGDPPDAAQLTGLKGTMREAVQSKHGLYDMRAWTQRIATLTSLQEEVMLLGGERVTEAAQFAMECVPWTIRQSAPLPEERVALRQELPKRIRRLGAAMADELRAE